LETTSWL